MFVFSLPFLAFALPILQHCLTAAHPIKAPARIDLQPLLTLMQMSSAQLIGVVLGAAGWSSAFRGNFETRKRAHAGEHWAGCRYAEHFLQKAHADRAKAVSGEFFTVLLVAKLHFKSNVSKRLSKSFFGRMSSLWSTVCAKMTYIFMTLYNKIML